jgi:hypothetical protein
MDIGTSITISTGILGIVAIIFRIFTSKNDNSNREDGVARDVFIGKHCPEHSGVMTGIDYLKAGQVRIEAKLDRALGEK